MNTLDTATTREITRQIAGLVAAELSDTVGPLVGWAVDTSPAFAEHRAVYLDGPDGQRIALALDWRNADRVEIRGVYPVPEGHSLPYGTKTVQIGVGRDRGPRVLAREIVRRLLPEYVEELGKVRAHVGQADDIQARRVAAASEIASRVGGKAEPSRPQDGAARVSWSFASDSGAGYGDASVSGTSVRMTLNGLDHDLAAQVAQVLANYAG